MRVPVLAKILPDWITHFWTNAFYCFLNKIKIRTDFLRQVSSTLLEENIARCLRRVA